MVVVISGPRSQGCCPSDHLSPPTECKVLGAEPIEGPDFYITQAKAETHGLMDAERVNWPSGGAYMKAPTSQSPLGDLQSHFDDLVFWMNSNSQGLMRIPHIWLVWHRDMKRRFLD